MVIGLFATPADAALCLDNLAEADFASRDISLVMRTRREAEAIADVSGPLNGIAVEELARRLQTFSLALEEAAAYTDGVLKGGVFMAVSEGIAEDAAAEIMTDNKARYVRRVDEP